MLSLWQIHLVTFLGETTVFYDQIGRSLWEVCLSVADSLLDFLDGQWGLSKQVVKGYICYLN